MIMKLPKQKTEAEHENNENYENDIDNIILLL